MSDALSDLLTKLLKLAAGRAYTPLPGYRNVIAVCPADYRLVSHEAMRRADRIGQDLDWNEEVVIWGIPIMPADVDAPEVRFERLPYAPMTKEQKAAYRMKRTALRKVMQ